MPCLTLTQSIDHLLQGHDITKHILSSFGGAGGQHACALARALGIPTVFIHKYSSVLSAVGMGVADVVHEEQCPFDGDLENSASQAMAQLDTLESKAHQALMNKVERRFATHTFTTGFRDSKKMPSTSSVI